MVEKEIAELKLLATNTARQVRLLRAMLVLSLTLAAVLMVVRPGMTQGAGTTLRAPVQVVDGQGKPIIVLSGGWAWGGKLEVLSAGQPVAGITPSAGSAMIFYRDHNTGRVVEMGR